MCETCERDITSKVPMKGSELEKGASEFWRKGMTEILKEREPTQKCGEVIHMVYWRRDC